MRAAVEGLLKALQHAISSQLLYPPEHPVLQDAADRVSAFLRDATARSSAVSVFAIEDRVVHDGVPLAGVDAVHRGFFQALRAAGYDRLTIRRGATRAEIAAFIGAVAETGRRGGDGA
jgi:hypothetical protein